MVLGKKLGNLQAKVQVPLSPEIIVHSRTESAEFLLKDTSQFASLVPKSLSMLTKADRVFQC